MFFFSERTRGEETIWMFKGREGTEYARRNQWCWTRDTATHILHDSMTNGLSKLARMANIRVLSVSTQTTLWKMLRYQEWGQRRLLARPRPISEWEGQERRENKHTGTIQRSAVMDHSSMVLAELESQLWSKTWSAASGYWLLSTPMLGV